MLQTSEVVRFLHLISHCRVAISPLSAAMHKICIVFGWCVLNPVSQLTFSFWIVDDRNCFKISNNLSTVM